MFSIIIIAQRKRRTASLVQVYLTRGYTRDKECCVYSKVGNRFIKNLKYIPRNTIRQKQKIENKNVTNFQQDTSNHDFNNWVSIKQIKILSSPLHSPDLDFFDYQLF